MLDDDLRHAERNEEARERAATQLAPAMDQYMAKFFEVKVDDLPRVRDAVKAQMRREDRAKMTSTEILKWAIGATLGAATAWFATHVNLGGGR